MINSEIRFNELIRALKECNFRLTPQRVELVRLIASSEGHPSANQFYEQIKKKFPTMSHATVYKTLAILKEMNQVFEITLREDSHYDGNRPDPHPHLICTECNKIVDGETIHFQEAIQKLADESGYLVLRPQVMLYGVCPECREKM